MSSHDLKRMYADQQLTFTCVYCVVCLVMWTGISLYKPSSTCCSLSSCHFLSHWLLASFTLINRILLSCSPLGVCVCLCTTIFTRTSPKFRPWQWGHFGRLYGLRTWEPCLREDLILGVLLELGSGFRFRLGTLFVMVNVRPKGMLYITECAQKERKPYNRVWAKLCWTAWCVKCVDVLLASVVYC